ncbi:MAG TPA: isoamylase early set domain-containing protein [Candidatus Ozemobacteraceae bacterium]|nr:isoamylase early set domain-containing protein [Candidatus Ozemobacteraceae bacterium]
MLRFLRFVWKLFIVGSVFGIGYIIGREHSFEEDEEWDNEEENKSADAGSQAGGEAPKKAEPAAGAGSVTFEYADSKATSVSVVGDFNDWNKDTSTMKNENGVWKCSMNLKPGRHEYKFVINQTDWISDPKAKDTVADKYGGSSSVIEVR